MLTEMTLLPGNSSGIQCNLVIHELYSNRVVYHIFGVFDSIVIENTSKQQSALNDDTAVLSSADGCYYSGTN